MNQSIVFLIDVFLCSLSSFGGPEAHYGVFSHTLVHKKKYINENTLTELIGVFSLVPGPSSTQTITAIGYLVGGPWIAFFTFLIWAFPAMVMMTLVGLFFSNISQLPLFTSMLEVLPPIAVGFIFYAGWSLTKRVVLKTHDWIVFIVIFLIGFLIVPLTFLAVPMLLVAAGLYFLWVDKPTQFTRKFSTKPMWFLLFVIILIAILGELLFIWLQLPWLNLFNSFYRYGYSVVGGGQIVIPLMIQDLVTQQSLISLETFLSGYAIDQAIPGPLFSFAAFVGTQSLSGTPLAWLGGFLTGLGIFIPGVILVYFVVPIWKNIREVGWMKVMLKGITIAAASLICLTAFTQTIALAIEWTPYVMVGLTFLTLIWKKISTPILVVLLITFGLIFQSMN
jgi:chromate transporter